jgi:hypothetical protein
MKQTWEKGRLSPAFVAHMPAGNIEDGEIA